ncbi:PREDICTED: uncharacterized protein LOC104803870 [Tarenaya hassleriana]|uniref:uncharacterized protein LOC104803870 n=1 Tax=Tarenaya hassleriana TaxID=28532 RepID=UPI00053C665F|nr:PREDICTED: uncharacterized protein LOC104803870 [Tarenaya hassleriana]
MEILVGPTFGIDAAYVRGRSGVAAQDKKAVPAGALFMAEESGPGMAQIGSASRIVLRGGVELSPEESSESSSSIGAPGESSENDDEEDDAVSSQGGGLGSFTSLNDSLPIKRGLSSHYVGKSKSFGNLMEANVVKNLEKAENPFNKRRRLLIANKLRRRRSGRSSSSSQFYAWKNPNSMPLLALQESDNEDHDECDDSGDDGRTQLQEKRNMVKNSELMAQTQSCFCLSSLQEVD